MDLGAILLPASTAERHPAVLVGTPQRNTEIIAIPLAHGASILIRSIDARKLAPAAARLPTTMLTIRIATVRGFRTVKRSISAPRRARPAETLVTSMLTMWIPTTMGNAMTAGLLFR